MNPLLQIIVNVISTVVGLGLIAIASNVLKNVLDYKKQILKIQNDFIESQQDFIKFKTQTEERLTSMQNNCADRLEWMRKLETGLNKMNLNIVSIGTRMQMEEKDFHKLDN